MKNKRIKDIEIISKGSYYNLIYTDKSRALLQVGKDRLLIPKGKDTEIVGYNFNDMDLSSDNLKDVLRRLGYPVIM
ncbi:hypothetical protein U0035_00530 [Niabella yanshanensis]|uniref:Uncharacterized protein n=1 Tax=Niabella yanshanensis TaxID=577386 RepID=A0ABZ0W619_9BACT|nr:hypothetical protein [Niabella yanshanensis]WQD38631.1 hypothetical protein U0035_00530 [Niabella yanshanensis]